jgi:hypothetical protein
MSEPTAEHLRRAQEWLDEHEDCSWRDLAALLASVAQQARDLGREERDAEWRISLGWAGEAVPPVKLSAVIRELIGDIAREEERKALLMLGQPWSLRSIVEKLSAAVQHLFGSHDCDGHGWEEFATARREADKWLAALDARSSQDHNAAMESQDDD